MRVITNTNLIWNRFIRGSVEEIARFLGGLT
jgi:hypothetical protein